AQQH
ncbi:hypothetical protein ACTFIW_013297, partial [Dictyostelium discoideum]